MKNSVIKLIAVLGICVAITGCSSKTGETQNENQNEVQNAEVNLEGAETQPTKGTDSKESSESVMQVKFTEDMKEKLLELSPGLFGYTEGKEITEQNMFQFIYYGYGMNDIGKYKKTKTTVEGVTNSWAIIPESDVKEKFKETFGIDMGEYVPKLDEFNPTIYKDGNNYYICINEKIGDCTYEYVTDKATDKGHVVEIKAVYTGGSTELYNVTIEGASNKNGFTVKNVVLVPN